MKKLELETLIKAGSVGSFTITYVFPTGYLLYITPAYSLEPFAFTAALGHLRYWSSIDSCVSFLRSMGCHQNIVLSFPDFLSSSAVF